MTKRMLMMCALFAIGVAGSVAGCGSAATAVGPDDGECESNDDCPGGQVCADGTCTDTGGGGDTGTGGSDGGTGGGDTGTGGSDGGTGGGDTGGCTSNEQCPPGTTCQDGTCICDGEDPPGDSCGSGKSLMCHYPPGHPENRHEICVGNPAVPAHLAHGDSAGNCP